MSKKILNVILYIMILIVLSSLVYATTYSLCYQETANDSSIVASNPSYPEGDCGIYTGAYNFSGPWVNPERVVDGDWSNEATADVGNYSLMVNYTKPIGAIWAIWQSAIDAGAGIKRNDTVPDDCFNQDPIQLNWSKPSTGGKRNHTCFDGSVWKDMTDSITFAGGFFKEEGMWWNVTDITNLSITFRDETDNTLITGETFSVYLEKSGFSQLYSATTNPYVIPNLDVDIYTQLKVSSTNYLEREYFDVDLSDGNRTTPVNLTVYLINTTDGSETTFYIVDEGLNPLEDVFVVFTRIINGTRTTVAEEESDFAGKIVLDLDDNYKYRINFSKANYEDKEINLEPTESDYVIELISTVGAYNVSVYEGITYSFSPSNIVLTNNTKYNFTFTLNSSIWEVTNCTLTLKNGSTQLSQTSGYTSSSCYLRIEQDTFGMTNITSEAVYELDSAYNFTVIQQYKIIYTYEGDFSLKSVLDDISSFAMAGFDDFGRMMLALIVIFIITALAAKNIGFTNPEVLIFLVVAQVWFFSYVNWLYMDFVPNIVGLRKYFIAILITLAGGAFVMKKFTD